MAEANIDQTSGGNELGEVLSITSALAALHRLYRQPLLLHHRLQKGKERNESRKDEKNWQC